MGFVLYNGDQVKTLSESIEILFLFSLRYEQIHSLITFSIKGLAMINVDSGDPAGLFEFAPNPIIRVCGIELLMEDML